MTTETDAAEELKLPTLKVDEPEMDPGDIWGPDKLDREAIATRLTTIIEDERAPFVISLDGRWGTGKTFLLKRWQVQLDQNGYQAIYFNAWEDDFCDDPLLAIIGQLSEHFGDGKFKDVALKIANFGVGLVTKQLTGTAVDITDFKPESILDDYHEQRRTKEKMKTELLALAEQVRQESGKPLVFIIDELDRCRPTFAIELLERVKHIFDVPNIFFVFGINRSELVKSLESVYGEIDAGVYLRRFFDMEFILPDADPDAFCKHLVQRYGLDSFFADMNLVQGGSFYHNQFMRLSETLPVILGHMGLSLRDMDYCVRLIALVGRGLQKGHPVFPNILPALTAVKISNPALYQRFVQGSARGAEVVNYLNERRALYGTELLDSHSFERVCLDRVEAAIYVADNGRSVAQQLKLLQEGKDPNQPELISVETRNLIAGRELDRERLSRLLEVIGNYSGSYGGYRTSAPYLAELIDVYDRAVRR